MRPLRLTSCVRVYRLAVLLGCWLIVEGAASGEVEEAQRQLLATGDLVPGIGRIGDPGQSVLAIDDRGRLLVYGHTSSAGRQVFWTDGRTTDLVWDTDDPATAIDPGFDSVSPAGRIVGIGAPLTTPAPWPSTLYQVRPAPLRPHLGPGDHIRDGHRICQLAQPRVSDAGVVGLAASVVASGGACETDAVKVLLRLDTDGAAIIAGAAPALADDRRFDAVSVIGVADDGAVVFQGERAAGSAPVSTGVYAADLTAIRAVVEDGDPDPTGGHLLVRTVLAANGRGETLFTANESQAPHAVGLYRTDHGHLVRLGDDRDPDGRRFTAVNGGLNRRGDAVLSVVWPAEDGEDGYSDRGVLLYRTGEDAVVISTSGQTMGINDARQVALTESDARYAARWRGGTTTVVVRAGDPAPGGGYLLSAGIRSSCLADDGRVGAIVATPEDTALLCIDARGPHLIARAPDVTGTPVPPLRSCAFGGLAGEMAFATHNAVYRVTAGGIEPVFAGASIEQMGWTPFFDSFRARIS